MAIAVPVTEEEYKRLAELARMKGFESVKQYMKAVAVKPPSNTLEKLLKPG